MNRLVVAVLAGASLFPIAAKAADIIEPIPVVEETPADYSGWYIRADAGYVFSSETDGSFRYFDAYSGNYGDEFRYSSIELKDSYSLGAGVGYRWAEHFRTDLAVDYYDFDVKGRSDCPYSGGSGCRFNDSSKADLWTVMANAYVDLPYFGPITPYFGAGIGFANVSYGDMRNEICSTTCGDPNNYLGVHEGEDSWRFANSLMAGASIDLTHSLALDVGYRWTHVYEGKAFAFDAQDRAAGASGIQGRDNGFDIHAVRAGLRYSFF
ncbi:outer membrane protein [Aureimonas sp. AU40]|uniref:outer membrane protein n=1 Tax=Aureimonas sp. AU40 TaxID=1637747 RepID=UPI0007840B4F|nr:outer membrane protein [Aureimonas sp. AU40]